jgi:hypothetical protein
MKCEVKDTVTFLSRQNLKIMNEFLLSIAGEVDEFDVVMFSYELENRKDAESVFEVMIPKRFEANDVLSVTSC